MQIGDLEFVLKCSSLTWWWGVAFSLVRNVLYILKRKVLLYNAL